MGSHFTPVVAFQSHYFAPQLHGSRGASCAPMSRRPLTAICALVFSLPAAVTCLMLWPICVGRPVPSEWNADAMGIALVTLTLGMSLALAFNVSAKG